MARSIDMNSTAIYRVLSTARNKRDDTTSTSLCGPYTTMAAAKGQARVHGWYNHETTKAQIQQLGIETGDGIPLLAWIDVAVWNGTGWVNMEEKNA